MKILIVNISDIEAGASRAAYRLHQALLSQNVQSEMLVGHKYGDDFRVKALSHSKVQKGVNLLRPTIDNLPLTFYKKRKLAAFTPAIVGFSGVLDAINERSPDIVHLHWIGAGMIKVEDLGKIDAPIVWSLHDMWAFTGGCHYDENCQAYEKQCGSCPVLGSSKEHDLSRKVHKRKEKAFRNIENMSIVGLSRWISDCAKKSSLLKDKSHYCLPNPIDTKRFKDFDKEKARELWGLPSDKHLVLFGAMAATSDSRKGFKELQSAFSKLDEAKMELVVFGSSAPEVSQNFGLRIHYLGRLSDDVSLMTLYNAVDVLVIPSLQENLSNVIMESLACGTPVVGFDIGGNADMVEHKKTGYLADMEASDDLARGINWVLNSEGYEELCKNSREKVLKEFDSVMVAKRYMELYKGILK